MKTRKGWVTPLIVVAVAIGCSDGDTVTGPASRIGPARSPTSTRTPALAASTTGTPTGAVRTRSPTWTASMTPTATSTPGAAPFGLLVGTGSATWTGIDTALPLCREIRDQVGDRYPLIIKVDTNAFNGAVLALAHHGGGDDDSGEVYRGTRFGNAIRASAPGLGMGYGCPADPVVTPQTGGELTASLNAGGIEGDYTEVYGSGEDRVVFRFHFQARFSVP